VTGWRDLADGEDRSSKTRGTRFVSRGVGCRPWVCHASALPWKRDENRTAPEGTDYIRVLKNKLMQPRFRFLQQSSIAEAESATALGTVPCSQLPMS
jgi:hypothetical protein